MEPTDKQRSNYLGAVFTGLCLGALMLVCLGAATTGPFPPSPFTLRTGTNTDAAGWRAVLGVSTNHGGSFTNAGLTGGSVTGQTNSDLTASRVMVSSSAKVPASSSVTTTELGYLSGVTNSIQSELNAKATAANLVTVSNAQVTTDGKLTGYVTNLGGFATNAALTGGTVTSQTNLDLTASRVMLSDANKVPTSSSVTATTLGYLDATSSVQTQLDSKPTVALTNLMLLSANNSPTGTNTFSTNTVFGTNIVGDFVTVGSRCRTLYVGASNYFTGTPGALETNLYASITLPPLMSEKSQILCGYRTSKTNITSQPIWWWEFRADTTNGTVVAGFGALAAANYWQSSAGPSAFVMENEGFDYQFVGPFSGYVATVVPSVMTWNTLASTNVLHVLLHHGSAANTDPLTVRSFVLIERY